MAIISSDTSCSRRRRPTRWPRSPTSERQRGRAEQRRRDDDADAGVRQPERGQVRRQHDADDAVAERPDPPRLQQHGGVAVGTGREEPHPAIIPRRRHARGHDGSRRRRVQGEQPAGPVEVDGRASRSSGWQSGHHMLTRRHGLRRSSQPSSVVAAQRARPAAPAVDPVVVERELAAGRVLRPAGGVGADHRGAEAEQPGQAGDRRRPAGSARPRRRTAARRRTRCRTRRRCAGRAGRRPAARRPPRRGGRGPRRGRAARGRTGRGRGGRRCAPRRPSARRRARGRRARSAARPPSTARSRRRHAGSVAAGPTRNEPSIRRWACSVRPSSKRISRCLPWASASRSTAPVRSTPTRRGSRVTQRCDALAGEAAVDPLGQPADGVTLRHPARCSAASPRRRPR